MADPYTLVIGLEVDTPAGPKKVGLIRVHLEEDAGKLLHDESGGGKESKVDLNRTGTPLLEIVSRPEINSPEEASTYLQELRLLLRELEVSDCEMQEGSLRCDANVNLHIPQPDASVAATPIVEVKNLNSFRFVAYFEEAAKAAGDAKAVANWATNEVLSSLNERKQTIADFPLTAARLAELVKEIRSAGLNKQRARDVYAHMVEQGTDAAMAIRALGITAVADEGQIRELLRQGIGANPQAVADS